MCLDNGANHASAQMALLIWRSVEGAGHGGWRDEKR